MLIGMGRKRYYIICSLAMAMSIIFCGLAYSGQQSSANYTIEKDVVSSGGGDMGSTGYNDNVSTTGDIITLRTGPYHENITIRDPISHSRTGESPCVSCSLCEGGLQRGPCRCRRSPHNW